MGLKDLENAGVTLPRHHWGEQTVRSTVNKPGFLVCAAGAITGAVLMFVGEGRLITWLGALLFLVSFFLTTAISFRAVASDGKSASTGRGT